MVLLCSFTWGKGLTDFSSSGPPLLHLHNGSAIGITVRKSNVTASLAQFIAGLGMPGSNTMENRSSTFGQLVYQITRGTKLSLLGLHQVPFTLRQLGQFGPLTIPVLLRNQHEVSEAIGEALPLLGTKTRFSTDSIALMVDSELDGTTKLRGWFEMKRLDPSVQWAVTLSDVSEDSFGWGMSISGMIRDSAIGDHFQAESYLNFNIDNKFCLKPGLAYVTDGNSKIAALMLRSNWSM